MSFPPTESELKHFKEIDSHQLPRVFKRKAEDRVFVNRALRLDKIKWFGFDMDYTLAEYIHPAYDEMIYDFTKERLIDMGYPPSIKALKYDHSFPIRCLYIDRQLGNLLKVGKFGEILQCMHGRTAYTKQETVAEYPAMQIHSDDIEKRYFPQQTLFSMPECCLYADIIDHLESPQRSVSVRRSSATELADHFSDGDTLKCNLQMTYKHLHIDVRTAIDWVHQAGVLKEKTLKDLPRYVHRDPQKLSLLFRRMRENGAKLFLLTNSEYYYTKEIMSYLLDGADPAFPTWQDYFDVAITSARKPSFFSEGTTFREVDLETGKLKLGRILSRFAPAKEAVYQGGSLGLFTKLTGARSTEVLYIGDHIFADIMMSKQQVFWRTLLVLPEVAEEVKLVDKTRPLINRLQNLYFMKAEIFRGLDVNSTEHPDISALREHIQDTSAALDAVFSPTWGSPFRSGVHQTDFSNQVERYADLYTGTFLNLANYPIAYVFSPETNFLPHEFE
jgi:5'-nucleotidase